MARQMKDSGVEWIGEIPKDWEVRPAKAVFTEEKRKNDDGLIKVALQFKAGTIIEKKNFDADSDEYVADTILNYTIVDAGTIIINGLNLNYDLKSHRVGLVEKTGVITSAYLALIPDYSKIAPLFAKYLFNGYEAKMAFHNMGAGIRLTLGYKEFKNQPVLIPTIEEQKRIVSFLDTQCSKIDAVLAQTRSSIEEYKKLKQAVITQAVTKGVRGDRPMKDSGIEWMDTIPETWSVTKIKRVVFPLNRAVLKTDDVITCFRDGEVTLRKNRREDGFTVSFTEHGYQGVEVGDLVIHGMDAFAGAVGCSDSRGKTSPVVHVCRTSGNNRFFMYALRYMAYSGVLMDFSNGIRIRSSDYRNFAKLGVFDFAVPPVEEQNEIVCYLDVKCPQIDSIISQKEQFLTELETYKKSLIYEYVTGKKPANKKSSPK